MAERFKVCTVTGYAIRAVWSPTKRPPSMTAQVWDTAYRRVVRQFRSEDMPYPNQHATGRRTDVAFARAQAECDRLNAKYPEGWPAA